MKKVIFILLVLFLPLLFVTNIYAQTKTKVVTVNEDEIINKDYFAAGDTVRILGTVNGDTYIAGGEIIVNGDINGDLLAAGGDITIRGNISQDVRVAGGNINIDGKIGGSLTIAAGNATIGNQTTIAKSLVAGVGNMDIAGNIEKGATLGGGSIDIDNHIGGDVNAGVDNLTISKNASISGNLNYWSENEATISKTASISGQIKKNKPEFTFKDLQSETKNFFTGAFTLIRFTDLIISFLIGLLLLKLLPVYTERTLNVITKNTWQSLLVGFLTFVFLPFISIFLILSLVGIPVTILLFIIFLIFIYLSRIFIAYIIGRRVFELFNWKLQNPAALLIGIIIYILITGIPVIGWLINLFVMFIGVGAILIEEKEFYKTLRNKKLI